MSTSLPYDSILSKQSYPNRFVTYLTSPVLKSCCTCNSRVFEQVSSILLKKEKFQLCKHQTLSNDILKSLNWCIKLIFTSNASDYKCSLSNQHLNFATVTKVCGSMNFSTSKTVPIFLCWKPKTQLNPNFDYKLFFFFFIHKCAAQTASQRSKQKGSKTEIKSNRYKLSD